MIATIRVYESKAARVEGVRELLATDEQDGKLVDNPNQKLDGDGSEEDRVSRKFGPTFDAMWKAGDLELSTQPHELFVAMVRGDKEVPLFDGPVTGQQIVPIPASYGFRDGDKIVTRYRDYSQVLSPSQNGVHNWYSEYQSCGKNIQSTIEGDRSILGKHEVAEVTPQAE
jgi:hypothetical protein